MHGCSIKAQCSQLTSRWAGLGARAALALQSLLTTAIILTPKYVM